MKLLIKKQGELKDLKNSYSIYIGKWPRNNLIRRLVCVSHLNNRCYSSRQRNKDTEDDSENANPTTGSEHKGMRAEVSKGGATSLIQMGKDTPAQGLRGGALIEDCRMGCA